MLEHNYVKKQKKKKCIGGERWKYDKAQLGLRVSNVQIIWPVLNCSDNGSMDD